MARAMALAAVSLQVLVLGLTRTSSGRAGVPPPPPRLCAGLQWFPGLSLSWLHGLGADGPLTVQSPLPLCHKVQVGLGFMAPKENVDHEFSSFLLEFRSDIETCLAEGAQIR